MVTMKRTRIAALALSLLFLGAALPVSAGQVQPVNTMTPYDTYVEPDTFLNGAVLDLKKTGDVPAFLKRELENMRYCYNINMVNLYGLEGFDSGDSTANKDGDNDQKTGKSCGITKNFWSKNIAVKLLENKNKNCKINSL